MRGPEARSRSPDARPSRRASGAPPPGRPARGAAAPKITMLPSVGALPTVERREHGAKGARHRHPFGGELRDVDRHDAAGREPPGHGPEEGLGPRALAGSPRPRRRRGARSRSCRESRRSSRPRRRRARGSGRPRAGRSSARAAATTTGSISTTSMVISGSARWTSVVNVPPPSPTIRRRVDVAVVREAEQRGADVLDRHRARAIRGRSSSARSPRACRTASPAAAPRRAPAPARR